MHTKKLTAVAVGMLCASVHLSVIAKTTTWNGGSSGQFSVASNWDNGAPASGDTAKFDTEVTLSAEDFDLGTEGLTVENSKTVTWNVRLSGSGEFVKAGSGDLVVKVNASHGGGTRLTRGAFRLCNSSCSPKRFGTGVVTIVRYDNSSPTLVFDQWSCGLTNPIEVKGPISSSGPYKNAGAIYVTNPSTADGSVSCDSDTYVNVGWGGITMNGAVTCPSDKILTFNCNCGGYAVTLNKSVDASIVKLGKDNLIINGVCPNKDNFLTVNAGTNVFGTAAGWAGTNIVVDGVTAVLRVQRTSNLISSATVLKISNGAKVHLSADVFVGELWVDGEPQSTGAYTSADFPNRIIGDGSVIVGANIWKGLASGGTWNAAENWSKGIVPGAGGCAVFTNAVTLANDGDVTIGTGNLTVFNKATLSCPVSFVGEGSLTKTGPGDFEISGSGSSHADGTTLRNGRLVFVKNNSTTFKFGTGPIRIFRRSASSPAIYMSGYNSGIANDIFIDGAITGGDGAIYSTNMSYVNGAVTGNSDTLIKDGWGDFVFNGPLAFAGKTVTFLCICGKNGGVPCAVTCTKSFDGSLVKQGSNCLYFNGSSSNPDDMMTIDEGTLQFGSAAFWAGTNVVVGGATSVLRLTASGNLSPETSVNLGNGGRLYLGDGVRTQVAELFLDGGTQPSGVYHAGNLPQYIDGPGRIVVGHPGIVIIVR